MTDETEMLIDMLCEKLNLKVLVLVGFKDEHRVYGGIIVKDEHFTTNVAPKTVAKYTYKMVLKVLRKAQREGYGNA